MDEQVNQAREVVESIVGGMGMEVTVTAFAEDEHVTVQVKGDDAGLLIGKKGQVLDALQYLVNRMLGHGETARRGVVVDADGYRERRADSLAQLAQRLSEKALSTGKIVALNPMSARDRRIIHMTLRDTPGVSTRSEGEGEERRLLIVPASAAT